MMSPVPRLSHRVFLGITLAFGWTRFWIACGAGAIGALALPPFGIFPALILSLVPAIWLLDGAAQGGRIRTVWSAGLIGWAWGFGYFLAGLWWLGSAFLVDPEFTWAMPLGVVGLPVMLAFFPALGFALARSFWSKRAGRIFAFAAGLAFSEYLRGHLFTGFPWNTIGMALGQNLHLMQGASIIGLYGLTILAILIAAAPAVLATGETMRARLGPLCLAFLVFAGLFAFGAWRLSIGDAAPVAGVKLRIMQPNLQQDAKFGAASREAILGRYFALSDRAASPQQTGIADVTHLIWPESAFPFLLHQDARALAEIGEFLPTGVTLVTGAARVAEAVPQEKKRRFYNSIQVLSDAGVISSTYDKIHLVPFGEYVPAVFETLLERLGLRQFVSIPGGFRAGDGGAALSVPGWPLTAPSICYEAIFPGEIVKGSKRPGLILNVTNDAWFGRTPGPYQHFAQARLRSVEEGLPSIRAANTGISGVIDPYGRILQSLPLGVEGILDSNLPSAIISTLYARFGDAFFAILFISCILLALLFRRDARRV